MSISIKDFEQVSANYDGRIILDSETGTLKKGELSKGGRLVAWFRKTFKPGSLADENKKVMASFIKAIKNSSYAVRNFHEVINRNVSPGKPLTGRVVRQIMSELEEIKSKDIADKRRSALAHHFAKSLISIHAKFKNHKNELNTVKLRELRNKINQIINEASSAQMLTKREINKLKNFAEKLGSEIDKTISEHETIIKEISHNTVHSAVTKATEKKATEAEKTQKVIGDISKNLVHSVINRSIDTVYERQLRETAINLLKDSIPSLKNIDLKKALSDKTINGLSILLENKLLSRTLLNRLSNYVLYGLPEGSNTKSNISTEDIIKSLNTIVPELASGNSEYIDTILGEPYLDSFALRMKLILNGQKPKEEQIPPEIIEIKHRCGIAKRELAKKLFIKTGFRKKMGFQSHFRSIKFDDYTVQRLLKNPKLRYKHVDLLLANVILLEAKASGKFDNSEGKREIANQLKSLGFGESIEDIQRYIDQDFENIAQVKRIAVAVEKFAKKISQDEDVLNIIAEAHEAFSDRVKAKVLLDTILRNLASVQAENMARIDDPVIKEAMLDKIIKVFSDLSAEKIHKSLEAFVNLNSEINKLQGEIQQASYELESISEAREKAREKIDDIKQDNKDVPKGLRSSKKIKTLFSEFAAIRNMKSNNKLNEASEKIDNLLKLLNDLKNIHLDTMHTAAFHKASKITNDFRSIISKSQKAKSLEDKYKVLEEAVNFLEEHKINEKAEAIIILRKANELNEQIDKAKKKLAKMVTKQGKLFGKEPEQAIKYAVYTAILKDFLDSEAPTFSKYQPNWNNIKNNLKLINADIKVNEIPICEEISQKTINTLDSRTLSGWSHEIKLSKELRKAIKETMKSAPKEHIKLIEKEKLSIIAEKAAEQVRELKSGQELTFEFGKSVSISVDEIPAQVDIGISFSTGVDNSVSIARDGDNYVVILKGGKSAGAKVDVSALLKVIQVSAGVTGRLAQGCSLHFKDRAACEEFIKALVTGRANANHWANASSVNLIFETEAGVEVEAKAGISKDMASIKAPDFMADNGSFDLAMEAEISAQAGISATWSEEKSASMVKKSRTISYNAGINLDASINIGQENIPIFDRADEALEKYSEVTGREVEIPDGISRGIGLNFQVSKTSEVVTRYGFVTADTNIQRSIAIGSNPRQTILGAVSKFGLKFHDQDDPRWQGITELIEMASENDTLTIKWALKEEKLEKIWEYQSKNENEKVREILSSEESYEPVEISLTTSSRIEHSDSRSYKFVSVSKSSSAEKTTTITVDLTQETTIPSLEKAA